MTNLETVLLRPLVPALVSAAPGAWGGLWQAGMRDPVITLELFLMLTHLGLDVSVPTNEVSVVCYTVTVAQLSSPMPGLLAWTPFPKGPESSSSNLQSPAE